MFNNYTMDNGLAVGIGFTASSGKPSTALAANSRCGNGGEIPNTPRGEGFETDRRLQTRTPFEFQVDLQGSYNMRFGTPTSGNVAGQMFQQPFSLRLAV